MNKWKIEEFRRHGGLGTARDGMPDDVFLVCASYEPRSVALAESLRREYRSKRAIIYVNREFLDGPGGAKTKPNLERLREILIEHCDSVDVAEGSWLDPKAQLLSLRDALVPRHSVGMHEAMITFDTTTFNREALLTAAILLHVHFPKSPIRAVYVSPEDHGGWLSRGFRCVRNVMGFAGIQQASRSSVLAVLSGFEPERTLKIIEEHEPIKVLLGIGDPPTTHKFLERNVNEQTLILSRQDVESFTFPADNIEECWECLERLLRPYLHEYNLMLAPMSTKLSTLGAFLMAECHPEIQISYCIPGEYNIEDYSIGADNVFVDQIPFGKPKE